MMAKKIVLTGGGTAGHVTPNLALVPSLKEAGYEVYYIGSKNGIEKSLVEDYGLPYSGVSSGKLRRYFDPKNFSDPFRIIKGYFEAKKLIKTIKPDIVFSKGGFVSVPIVKAAHSCHVPCIIHESDLTPGLANKLCTSSAKKVCCNFPETVQYLPKSKAVHTGTPIRAELSTGSREAALSMCGFSPDKPVMVVIGGSLGARNVNIMIRNFLDDILKSFQVIHICGKDNLEPSLEGKEGYRQFEYIKDELKDVFAAADIVVSRAGANAICELLYLKKPNLLIPLPTNGSRGDQLLNAASFESMGYSMVLKEEDIDHDTFMNAIHKLYENREEYSETMKKSPTADSISIIMGLIKQYTK